MEDQRPEIGRNFIDLDKVIKSKSKTLYRMLPGFLLSYLKRIVHQDDINDFIYRHRKEFGIEFARSIIRDFEMNVKVVNEDKIPATGRYIMASNHPLGGFDGIAFITTVGKFRSDIIFPVNDLLMNLPNLKQLFIPINKHGSNAENVKIINDTFASEKMILYFPAGLVSRKIRGEILDLPWKKTFITKARTSKRDVIPVFMDGRISNRFYRIANARKKLGIKANIEMLYLVDEQYKQQNKNLTIIIGDPIPYTTFDRTHNDNYWAEWVRGKAYELKNQIK